MAAKNKKPEKAKANAKKAAPKMVVTSETLGPPTEDSFLPAPRPAPRSSAEVLDAGMALVGATASVELDHAAPAPQALTLPLLTDSATLFIQGVQQLTAQLLGTPESAVMLVNVNGWIEGLSKIKKLIVGNDDEISGLKKLVIEQGQPWGEKGSKQLTLAGAVVKVKAVNHRDPDAPLTIEMLDAAKVEAYLRGVQWTQPIEKVLACYMKPTTVWGLKDLPPQQAKNLATMLADPDEDGQGLRQCLKDTKYQMMAPEMENAP